jgi:hypothetical protein
MKMPGAFKRLPITWHAKRGKCKGTVHVQELPVVRVDYYAS